MMRRKQFEALRKLTLPPEEWCLILGVRMVDPDGWRGDNGRDWTDPIGLDEFLRRSFPSTMAFEDGATDFFDAEGYSAE